MKKNVLTLILCVTAFAFTTIGHGQELYKADFTTGEAIGWVAAAGTWEVKDNPVTGDPKQLSGDSGDKHWAYYDGASFENYEADVVIYPQWGNPFGIVFNMTDEDNYFVLELSGKHKVAWVWQVEGGEFVNDGYKWEAKPEDEGNFYLHRDTIVNNPWIETDPDPSNYFTVNINCDADGLTTITVNGGVVFEELDDAGTKGKIGAWANWNPTFLKSLEVKSLSGVNVPNLAIPKINIYPNPVVDILKLSTMVESIEVFNITGMKVRSAIMIDAIDMSGLNSGIYFIRLNGQETRKIMVK